MISRRQEFRREGGFTLVEILVAIGIAGFLFTGMWMSLNQVVQSRTALANMATPFTLGPAILDTMGKDLRNVYFYDFAENNTFYAVNNETAGREADALSMVTLSRTFQPDLDNYRDERSETSRQLKFADEGGRHSYINEVSYLIRPGQRGFLELWRRESWGVNDAPHTDGEYILLYDKVHSFQLQYIARAPSAQVQAEQGVRQAESEGGADAEMIVDEWNPVQEASIPRAVLVTLRLYAQDELRTVEEILAAKDRDTDPPLYTFQRYLSLPQFHLSPGPEQLITSWDGNLNGPVAAGVANRNRGNAAGGNPGAGGGRGNNGGANGGRGNGGRGNRPPQGTRPNGTRPTPGANPFLDALRRSGGGAGGARGGGGGGARGLFGGGGR